MQLTDALKLAQTEHVVYFLLAAYVETLDFYDPARSSVPAHVKRLPMAGRADVVERLRALRDALRAHRQAGGKQRAVIQEAVDVFSAACQRLRTLRIADPSVRERLTQLFLPSFERTRNGGLAARSSSWTRG